VAQRLGTVHPFLDYGVEIRKVLCSTDAIESMNARYRRTVPVRGTEQAALKYLYLVTRSLDPNGAESDRVDHALEASTEGLRGHLRRPDAQGQGQLNLKMEAAAYTGFLTNP
jgi:transposase-like protein